MVQIALTDATVRTLKAGRYFDEKMPAFGIRVGKHRRTWIVTKGRNRNTVTLGHYPAISLQDARKAAHAAFVAPEVAKATITFPEAKDAFLALDRWRPLSKKVLTSNLKKFTWKGQLAKITHEDVIAALDAIPRRSARAHALKDIRTFFNWCIPRYLPSSPAAGVRMEKQPSRDRVLTDEELKAVWIACEQTGRFGDIVRLLCLTGQRRGEVGALKASWMHEGSITVPSTISKNGREHTFAATTRMLALAATVSSASSRPFSAWSKSHAALLKLSGTSGWTIHDLRRSFASNQARLGTPIHIIEKILNHVSGSLSGVAGVYNRYSYFEEMKVAMQLHEDWLLSTVARR